MISYYPKLLVLLQFSLAGLMIYFSHGFYTHPYALSVFIMGLGIGIWALNHNKLGNFNIQPKHKENSYLATTGIYRFIRHPMYTSVIIMMFAFLISTPTWLESGFFLSLILVLALKAKREEKGLIDAHKEYLDYKNKTKYFIPFIF